MNINLTMLGQAIALFIFVWFCMKYVWPFILKALIERETRIADGLAAAEKGLQELAAAEQRVREMLDGGRKQAQEYIAQAEKRAEEIVEESKLEAREEGARLVAEARAQISQEIEQAREELRRTVATLALAGAEQVLMRSIDGARHKEFLDKLSAEL